MSWDQVASTSNDANVFSITNENAVTSRQTFEGNSSSQDYFDRHIVRAAELLARDSSTEVVELSKLAQKSTSIIRYVEIAAADGRLYCINGLMNTACWLKVIPFANDCHSYNVLLTLTTNGVIMKTMRNIDAGEALLMWFTDDILTMLDILFLRPFNIQGHNRYVCHICNKRFEFPNPLKVHIALKCDQLDINHLWTELENEFNLTMRSHNVQRVTGAAPANACLRAEQMEIIISNLGRSKQGHCCIYCGKVYSRKYGLKIHIRTHTGYKPLKCPYCSRPFGDPSNLNKHVRLHADGETPYRCDLCGKVLVRRRDLERHIKSRHQENVDQSSDSSSEGIDVESEV